MTTTNESDGISEHLRGMLAGGTTACPLCGRSQMHEHTPMEIIIYRNGVKYGQAISGVKPRSE